MATYGEQLRVRTMSRTSVDASCNRDRRTSPDNRSSYIRASGLTPESRHWSKRRSASSQLPRAKCLRARARLRRCCCGTPEECQARRASAPFDQRAVREQVRPASCGWHVDERKLLRLLDGTSAHEDAHEHVKRGRVELDVLRRAHLPKQLTCAVNAPGGAVVTQQCCVRDDVGNKPRASHLCTQPASGSALARLRC